MEKREPTPADDQILHALAQLDYLTVQQVVRLFYRPSSLTTAQTRMKWLGDHGYCLVRQLPRPAGRLRGTGANVYSLGKQGRAYLEAQGVALPERFKATEEPSGGFLRHAVACTDFFVAARLLCRELPELTVAELLTERTVKRLTEKTHKVRVNGRERYVWPDGWLAIHDESRMRRYPVALELDLSTEFQTAWREKVRALLAWLEGPYKQLFHAGKATIAVITPGDERRARLLQRWTEAELTQLGKQAEAAVFLFTGMNPAAVTAAELFMTGSWYEPFRAGQVKFLEDESGDA